MGTVVALAAQVGGAKLADGLYRLRGRELTVIVNTGDDYDHLGLLFSPDLDTVLYALAGIASVGAGWEPEGESRVVHGMLKVLGGPDRPPIGDKALAAPILRTEWLKNDRRLTQVTLEFCSRLGIQARILPMTDDAVRTNVLTDDGAVVDRDPGLPRGRRRQLAAHPRTAPLDERLAALGGRVLRGAKLPAQLGHRAGIARRSTADVGHGRWSRRKRDAASTTCSDHSCPPSNSSGRTVTPASRRRTTSRSKIACVYHSSRVP